MKTLLRFCSINIFLIALVTSSKLYAQAQISLYLTNPSVLSESKLSWDILIQNSSKENIDIKLLTAHLQHQLVEGTVSPSIQFPLKIELDAEYKKMEFFPQVVVKNGVSYFRLNGGAPPLDPPLLKLSPTLIGKVVLDYQSLIEIDDIKIGSTIAIPNVELSGLIDGIAYTFSLANGNLVLNNTWNENPLTFNNGEISSGSKNTNVDIVLDFYPNPTSQLVYFEVDESIGKNWNFEIYNQKGQVVYESNLGDVQKKHIDVSTYPAGTYFVHFLHEGFVTKKKLIKIN